MRILRGMEKTTGNEMVIKNPETEKFVEECAEVLNSFGQAVAIKLLNEFITSNPEIVHWEVLALKDEIVKRALKLKGQ